MRRSALRRVPLAVAVGCMLLIFAGLPARSTDPTVEASLTHAQFSVPEKTIDTGSSTIIAAAGDIACDPRSALFQAEGPSACGMKQTQRVVSRIGPDAILTLGDNQYVCGAYRAFERSFDATWGRFGPLLHPTPGDHEYMTEETGGSPCSIMPDARGYFRYFQDRAISSAGDSWYSFDLTSGTGTTWHIVSLNSNCPQVGGCTVGSPEELWLRRDLAAHPTQCALAYFYNPRFSSGNHGDDPDMGPFWDDLYRAGVDIVLNGHSHDYERFARQTPSGRRSAFGIRELVVGTGGIGLHGIEALQPQSQVFSATTLGVLRLHLGDNAYAWRFMPVDGGSFSDAGSNACHGPPP
jgi:hypothetical protein